MSFLLMIFLVVLSSYVIFRASFSFDIAASFLTRKMSSGVKGPTINAVASSLPELLISFLFLFHYSDLSGFSAGYAAIIGSAAFNICVIPCIAALTYFYYSREKSFKLNTTIIIQDSLFNIFSIITLGLIFYFGRITPMNSLVLMIVYSLYIYSVFTYRKTEQVKPYEELTFKDSNVFNNLIHLKIFSLFGNRVNKLNSILVVLISLILIALSCHLLTTSCESISSLFGVNLFYISFFIAAIASSLPDTILSVYDAKKGHYDDAFSNAFGSNIFDVCIGLGLPVFIYTLINGDILINDNSKFSSELLIISLILLLLVSVAIGILFSLGKFNKNKIIITLILYSLFIFSILSL